MEAGKTLYGGTICAALVGLLGLVFVASACADARPRALEVQAYQNSFGVSASEARENLSIQAVGTEADVVGTVEQDLGQDFAGVWFDNAQGEFVVPVAAGSGHADLSASLLDAGLSGDYRVPRVEYSWEELKMAQRQIDYQLEEQLENGLAQTSLDAQANAVVVSLAGAASEGDIVEVKRLAAQSSVNVLLRMRSTERFEIDTSECSAKVTFKYCTSPLRGGVAINRHNEEETYWCTMGFRARGLTNNKKYVLTAGHCVGNQLYPKPNDPVTYWDSSDGSLVESKLNLIYIGELEQYTFPVHDWAKINATGSAWDVNPWPSQIVYWGRASSETANTVINESYPIEGEATTFKGQTICHTGATTGTSCGIVRETNVSIYLDEDGTVHQMNGIEGGCSSGGDSGGPVFADHMALGMLTGAVSHVWGPVFPCLEAYWYTTNIKEATEALGVRIYPSIDTVPTKTTVSSATALNGNPGWLTVKGQVETLSGTNLNGTSVNVKLFKWENEAWALKATLPSTVTNNSYEISSWNGVGPGTWIAQAVFPAQGALGSSSSELTSEGSFTVKDGYRIVAKHSGRCLDVRDANKENGAMIQQWGCANPTVGLNQVFKLVPQGEYNQLVARHSNRCVDVNGVSGADGALVIQHVCKAAGENDNQLWKLVPAGGEYYELRAKHSNKCMDVAGAGMGDGVQVQQWSCTNVPQQKWLFQSVDSAPVPADVFITVPSGEVLNGQPGYVNVYGNVKAGAYPLAGRKVRVNYQKETAPNQWTTMSTAEPALNAEGAYAYSSMGVGQGNWRVRTVLPGEAPFAESVSPYKTFTIGRGYLFIFRNSGLCMSLHGNLPADGTPILQWYCAGNPDPTQGQVFHLVPVGGGYYQVKINSTGKCLDVTGASQAQGAKIQEAGCVGPNHTNQLFQVVPIAGQSPWFALIAKHSGQCVEVPNVTPGTVFQQWGCTWAGSQQWKFVPVS